MQAEILVCAGAADCLVFRSRMHPTEHRKAISLHKPFLMASTAPMHQPIPQQRETEIADAAEQSLQAPGSTDSPGTSKGWRAQTPWLTLLHPLLKSRDRGWPCFALRVSLPRVHSKPKHINLCWGSHLPFAPGRSGDWM